MSESEAAERKPDPDVLLDIPEVTVDQLRLAVDGLDADLSLRARLANLVQLDAGVRVHLSGVELDVTGVSAEALLKVRLEKLVQILDRALTTLDRNPQVIDALARAAGVTAEDVNQIAREITEGVAEPVVVPTPPVRPTPADALPPEPPAAPSTGAGGDQGEGGQGEGGQGEGGPASGAAQLAGQAGETLRQAGRSVWEAIQSGMGQNREQHPKR